MGLRHKLAPLAVIGNPILIKGIYGGKSHHKPRAETDFTSRAERGTRGSVLDVESGETRREVKECVGNSDDLWEVSVAISDV